MSPDAATPEEPADLAAAVAELSEAVVVLTADVEAQTFGVADEINALRTQVEALGEAQAQGLPVGASKATKAPAPRPWGQKATVEDWRTLVKWVDWLSATYDTINVRRIAPCWPAHGGVVHELAALRSAWLHCAAAPDPTDVLAYWHERLLWPLLMRLDRYRISACTEGHKDIRPAQLTNQDILEHVLDDVPSAPDHHNDAPSVDTSTGEVP